MATRPIVTQSPYEMVSVAQARQIIAGLAHRLGTEQLSAFLAQGRVLAEDIVSGEDIPPAPRSAVDGYAVRAADGQSPRTVLGEITAGHVLDQSVTTGTALRIMTGGLLPEGADSVVMVEDTSEQDEVVQIHAAVREGANVHEPGLDLRMGQVVLRSGTVLGPAELGMLATIGHVQVSVYRQPRVSMLATGDELVEPWENPPYGAIRDSNRYAVLAAAREAGATSTWNRIVHDDELATKAAIEEGLAHGDVLLTSGGVSMGTRDLIKPILEELGTVQFGRVSFKPGKPLTFATVGEKLVFGLPGFPVSSLVTFEVFVRPALLRMQGHPYPERPRATVRISRPIRLDPYRPEYQRAFVHWENGELVSVDTGIQASSRLMSMVGANALLELEAREGTLQAGDTVSAMLLATPPNA
ncbi:MAG: gephyrin-like molybdotransferase Glp [Chloroflexota bacterium]